MPTRQRTALLFFASSLLLVSAGRMNSSDALTQFQASLHLVATGKLGIDPAGSVAAGLSPYYVPTKTPLFQEGVDGRLYQVHDPGNSLLMLPVAAAYRLASGRIAEAAIVEPPLGLRAAVALWISLACSLAGLGAYRLFAGAFRPRTAFLVAVALVFGTYFVGYTKTCYDVVGCAVAVVLLLDQAGRLLAEGRPTVARAAGVGLAAALAINFRYTAGPFLAFGVAVTLLQSRRRLAPAHWIATAAALALGSSTCLAYNAIRSGNPLISGNAYGRLALREYGSRLANIPDGLPALLASPGRGLLAFTPLLLLGLAIPACWRRLPESARALMIAFLPAGLGYTVAIASLPGWNTFGWGPRYLVPVLPILFLPAGYVLGDLLERRRPLGAAILGLAILQNVAPIVANWSLLSALELDVTLRYWRLVPSQQSVVWGYLLSGLSPTRVTLGRVYSPGELAELRQTFPDLWTFHLMKRSPAGLPVGAALFAALLGLAVVLLVRFWRSTRPAPVAG